MREIPASPDAPRKRRVPLVGILIAVMSVMLAVCLVMGGLYVWEYVSGGRVYDNIAGEVVSFDFGEPDITPDMTSDTVDTAPDAAADTTADADTADTTAPAADTTAPAADTTAPAAEPPVPLPGDVPAVDFEKLRAINPDVVAWIYSPGTPISYPVVACDSEDDYDYYLNHLPDGTQNRLGTIFTDARNAGDFFDANTILYGHNMLNDTMFSSLLGYRRQAYYDAHPCFYIITPEAAFRADIFSAYTIKADVSHYRVDFDGDGATDRAGELTPAAAALYDSYAAAIAGYSVFTPADTVGTAADIIGAARMITLSTCDIRNDANRFLVFAVLRPASHEQ